MKIGKYDRIVSLAANVGVLLGIIFLIVEMNLNTKAVESDVAWSRSAMATSLLFELTSNRDFAETYAKFAIKPDNEIIEARDNFDVDYVQFEAWWRAERSYWESRYLTQTTDLERASLSLQILAMLMRHPGAKISVLTGTAGLHPEFSAQLEIIEQELGK